MSITPNISITGHQQLKITEGLKEHLNCQLQKIQKHFSSIIKVHVTLEAKKDQHSATAHVSLPHGDIAATASNADMYLAINGMVKKLDTQVKDHKEKMKQHRGPDLELTGEE